MIVRDLAARDVISIDINKDVLDALYTMYKSRKRVLPVLSESKFAGTVNISSYVKVLHEIKSRRPESIHISEIMDKKPITASPNTPIADVVDRVCEKSIYGLPVVSGHDLIGMVSREDVMKHFLPKLRGRFKVLDVMSYNVSTNSIHDTLESVGKKLMSGLERRVVIMDDSRVEGTISIRDMANALLAENVDLSTMSVKDILMPNPATVRKTDDAAKAAELMLEWGEGAVPVVDRELEGIVRDKDVIQRIHCVL